MFRFFLRPRFKRKYKKLVKRNPELERRIDAVLDVLARDPRDPTLESHKVHDRDGQPAMSSKVTGDLRILWSYRGDEVDMIDLVDIGGHSGSGKVYR